MAFPQPSDYRPPIIPDGEIYDNPENGKSYYWTQILLPEGSTPDTATSIGGYWTVVCEANDPRFLLRHGDTVDDCEEAAQYSWNDDVQFESTGLKGVLLPKEIEKSETDEKHITNKEYVDIQDGILAGEADARSEFLCAQFFKVVSDYSAVEKTDGHVIATYDFGSGSRKYWTRPPQPGFFENGNSYYINDQGPYEIEQVTESDKWVTFFIVDGPDLSVGSYASFSKTRKLCTEINFLQNDIIELEEEIDAIAPSVERGFFRSTAFDNIPRDGEFMLRTIAGKTIDYGDENIIVVEFSKVDDAGVSHTFADTKPGQLIQLFEDDDEDFGLYQIENITGTDPTTTAVTFTVSFVSGKGEATIGDLARLKIFSPPEGGDASEFVKKIGDEMSGPLTFKTAQETTEYSTYPNQPRVIFENTKIDGTKKTANLFQAGDTTALVTNGDFKTKSALYTAGYLYGWSGSSDTTYSPRIQLSSSAGYLKYGNTNKLTWNGNGVAVEKGIADNVTGSGFIIRGKVNTNSYTSSSYTDINGELLQVYHNASGQDAINYNGKITGNKNIATKEYVDSKLPTYTITKSNGNYYVS